MPSANKGDYDRARDAQRERDKSAAPASKGAAASKSAAPAKEKGIIGGIKDFFSGGAKAKSGTAGMRAGARARPDVVKTGSGKNVQYMDTKTGKSYAAPSYGAFSLKGLTSTDPANVARNRYGREALDAMNAARQNRDGPDRAERGLASLVTPPPAPGTETVEPVAPAPPTPAELAAIGAPTTPMAPTFVESPIYGNYGPLPPINYGTAFMGGPEFPSINWMDIFSPYPLK